MWYPSGMFRLLSLLGVLALTACSNDASRPPNVLLISVDSLRMDHVSAYGYRSPLSPAERTTPAVERLAAEGALFTNAMTSTSWTLPSHMALMTGMSDTLHGVVDNARTLDPAITTLAERLKARGYTTGGFFTGPNLHPAFGFDHGFDAYQNATGEELPDELFGRSDEDTNALLKVHNRSHHGITSPQVTQAGSRWLAEAAAGEEPFFLFMHYWDPHYNYEAPEDYVERFDPDYTGDSNPGNFIYGHEVQTPRDMQHVLAAYDAEIRFTDDHITHLLDQLDELGIADETLVVFTADHGDEFYEHGKKGHQRNFFSESIRIPLAMRLPGAIPEGVVVEPLVRIQDIAPTILELTDTALFGYEDGVSLVDLMHGQGESPGPQALELYLPRRDVHLSGLRRTDMLVVWDHITESGEYYDLRVDALEQRPVAFTDLATSDKLPIRLLREQLVELEERRANVPRTQGHGDLDLDTMDPKLRADLEANGYLGGADLIDDSGVPEGLQDSDSR